MTIFFDDNLNRTSPAFLVGSSAVPTGGTWAAVASSNGTGNPAMPGGSASLSGDIGLFYKNSATPASADYTVTGVFTAVADNWQFALLARVSGSDSYYQFFLSSGGARIDRKTSSDGTVGTQIGASSTNISIAGSDRTAHTLTFTVSGTSLSATVDGVAVQFGSGITTLTDSNITAAGVAGMGGRQSSIDSIVGDTLGGGTPVSFTGTVPTINAVVGTSGSVDLSSYFSGSLTPFTYTTHAGTLPTGFSRSGSVISWTTSTTAGTTTGIQVRATDTGSNVATTNSFNIVVAAIPSVTINDWVNNTGTDLGGTTGVDIAFLNDSTRALVLHSTNNTISGGHDITISNAAFTVSDYYVWVATKSSEPAWFASGRVQAV